MEVLIYLAVQVAFMAAVAFGLYKGLRTGNRPLAIICGALLVLCLLPYVLPFLLVQPAAN